MEISLGRDRRHHFVSRLPRRDCLPLAHQIEHAAFRLGRDFFSLTHHKGLIK